MTLQSVRWRFWILTFMAWLPIGFMIPVFVLAPLERGLTLGDIGLVLSAYGLTTVLLELPTGGLADAFGRRPVLIAAALAGAAMALVWYAGTTLLAFVIAAIIGGISRSLASGPLEAWFVDTSHDIDPGAPMRKGLAGGTVADALGLAAGSLAVTALTFAPGIASDASAFSSWRLAALLAAAAAVVDAIAIAALMREDGGPRATLRQAIADVPGVVRRATTIALRPGTIRLLFGAAIMLGLGFATVEMFYQPHFRDMLDSTEQATRLFGVLGTALSLAAAGGALVAGRIPEGPKFRPARISALALVVTAVAVVGFSLSTTVLVASAFFLAIYVVDGFWYPFSQQILHAGVESSERATMVSGWSLSFELGALVTGLVLAQMADRTGLDVIFWIAAGALVVAAVLYVGIDRISNAPETVSDAESGATDLPDRRE